MANLNCDYVVLWEDYQNNAFNYAVCKVERRHLTDMLNLSNKADILSLTNKTDQKFLNTVNHSSL